MNTDIFAQLQENLKRDPMPLDKALAFIRDAGSEWSSSQFKLFILCMDGVNLSGEEGQYTLCMGTRSPEEELADAVLEVVLALGKPLPAKEIRKRLPQKFVTTDEQIKAIAKKTQGLDVFGPGLIKAT